MGQTAHFSDLERPSDSRKKIKLIAFVRAKNTEGKIFPLLSSQTHFFKGAKTASKSAHAHFPSPFVRSVSGANPQAVVAIVQAR